MDTNYMKSIPFESVTNNVDRDIGTRLIKMQMTEYQGVHDFWHGIKDYGDNGYEEEYKCRTHIFYDFHCQVLLIRTMKIQT